MGFSRNSDHTEFCASLIVTVGFEDGLIRFSKPPKLPGSASTVNDAIFLLKNPICDFSLSILILHNLEPSRMAIDD